MNIKLSTVRNCGDENQIIKVTENSTLTINENCEVFSNVCAMVSADYDKAIVR